MRTFDSRPLLDFLLSYWRDYYKDTPRLSRFWEGLVRTMDDEWAQAEQADDAANVWSCPTLIYHTYLHRELENWKSYEVPHFHYRKDFRATAGQTIFYIGAWVSPKGLSVFVDGKELDNLADPFIITQVQDATQPGVNPTGSRLIFTNPRSVGQPVSIFSNSELFRLQTEVLPTGLFDILSSRQLDPFSVRLVLDKLNLTRFMTITPISVAWTNYETFKAGEVFEINDAGTVYIINITSPVATIMPPTFINPATTKVYKVVGLDVTKGSIWIDGKVLRSVTPFPANSRIRITDVYGSFSVQISMPMTSVPLERAVDATSAKVYFLSGEILEGYETTAGGLTFPRSYQEGTVLTVEAAIDEPNDHAALHEVTTAPTQDILLNPLRPLHISPGMTELPGFPIQVYIGSILQHPDTYTFISSVDIRLPAPIPAGVEVDVHWVDLEDPRPHRHIDQRIDVAQPGRTFALSAGLSGGWPRTVSVDGGVLDDPEGRWFSPDGAFLTFKHSIPQNSVIRARGMRFSYRFYHDIDPELIRAAYLQDGIDERGTQMPAGWTVQLPWEDGFLITAGLLEADYPVESAWFVDAYVDESTGYNNFGSLIGFKRATSDEYMRVLRALFSGNYMGCQRADIESLICILMGSQYLSHDEKVLSIGDGIVTAEKENLALDARVPPRVQASKTYAQLWAVSSFAEIVDEAPPDFLPQAAEIFSPDYHFAHALDTRVPSVLDGGPGEYFTAEHRLEDLAVDFVEENVWPGDLIKMSPTGYPSVYCRVISVDRHSLILNSDLTGYAVAYGEDDYGQWVYGGGLLIIQNVYYRAWVRQLDRLDEGEQLDRAREEDIPALNERLAPLLDPFVYKVHLRWDGIRDAQALADLRGFLRRVSPAEGSYLVYASVEEDAGIREEMTGALTDQDAVIEQYPDYVYSDEGVAGINGQVSPNAGSFVG